VVRESIVTTARNGKDSNTSQQVTSAVDASLSRPPFNFKGDDKGSALPFLQVVEPLDGGGIKVHGAKMSDSGGIFKKVTQDDLSRSRHGQVFTPLQYSTNTGPPSRFLSTSLSSSLGIVRDNIFANAGTITNANKESVATAASLHPVTNLRLPTQPLRIAGTVMRSRDSAHVWLGATASVPEDGGFVSIVVGDDGVDDEWGANEAGPIVASIVEG
jgi:hypothetical protein